MLVAKNLLIEMAVYSEDEVFEMNPVASVSTEATNNLEGEELRRYVYLKIQSASRELNCSISEDDIGVLIRHHCGFRPRKKAALLALPYIVSANLVTAPWRKQVDKKGKLRKGRDRRPSGMISAPIMIDGVRYLCNITNKTNLQGRITLYALTLKDGNGNIVESEKMADPSNVPHSNSEQSANGNAHLDNVTTSHEPNPSFQDANVQQNIETNNNNDIKTENIRMNKKQIRLTESDLKQIVKESVNKILGEAYGSSPQKDIEMANRYVNATYPDLDANSNLSWTTKDEYNDIAPELREIALGFCNIKKIIRSLEIGLNIDRYGSPTRRGLRQIKPKNSGTLTGMDNYLYTLDNIVDKGRAVLHRMTNRMVQNMGLNPNDVPY